MKVFEQAFKKPVPADRQQMAVKVSMPTWMRPQSWELSCWKAEKFTKFSCMLRLKGLAVNEKLYCTTWC